VRCRSRRPAERTVRTQRGYFGKRSIAARFERGGERSSLPDCQEAIQNALKHAHASSIKVTLDVEREHVRLEICDDGGA